MKNQRQISITIYSDEEIHKHSRELIQWAAQTDGMELTKYILPLVQDKYKSNPYSVFPREDPIRWAIHSQNLTKLKALIPLQAANKEYWNRIFSGDRYPQTPLSMALQTWPLNIDIIKEIAMLTDVDEFCPGAGGYSYLHMAVFTLNDDIFKLICSLARNKFPIDAEGMTPIDWRIKLQKEFKDSIGLFHILAPVTLWPWTLWPSLLGPRDT